MIREFQIFQIYIEMCPSQLISRKFHLFHTILEYSNHISNRFEQENNNNWLFLEKAGNLISPIASPILEFQIFQRSSLNSIQVVR